MSKSEELRQLADKFSEGWHKGIKIDAMDVMLLSDAASELESLNAALIQTQQAREDEVRDAERYRYLRDIRRRDAIVLSGPEAGVWCDAEDEDGTLLLTEDDLDAAIDAAIDAATLAAKEKP